MNGAEERSVHPEGLAFTKFFDKLLYATKTCWERDVLRKAKEPLWESWKECSGCEFEKPHVDEQGMAQQSSTIPIATAIGGWLTLSGGGAASG